MICDCKCHQNVNEMSNCGKCGNTGIKIENLDISNPIIFIPLEEKPIFSKKTTDLKNSITLSEAKLS